MGTYKMSEQDFKVADALAWELNGKADINELAKCVGFLRQRGRTEDFFQYLDLTIGEGKAVVRSQQTLDYYRAIRSACKKHLTPYANDPGAMLQVLGWAVRLMRYHAVPKDSIASGSRPTGRQH